MLINCVAYEDGRKLADIAVEDIGNWVHRPGCFVWVALRDTTDDELHRMQQQFGLHDLAVEDARHGHQRPKVEEYGDTIFVVMHLLGTESGEVEQGELAIFVGPNFERFTLLTICDTTGMPASVPTISVELRIRSRVRVPPCLNLNDFARNIRCGKSMFQGCGGTYGHFDR